MATEQIEAETETEIKTALASADRPAMRHATEAELAKMTDAEKITYFGDQIGLLRKSEISFEHVENIDLDTDLWFKLRGHSVNSLVDAATPIFGLIVRLKNLPHYDGNVSTLYGQVHGEIAAIEQEIRNKGYDNASILAYRYCLCSVIDEAIMANSWGAQSIWSERSLLSVYHNETWGGEKFFTILERMQQEPSKYEDMLGFIYMCLCLGFKGKYNDEHNRGIEADIEPVISRLHEIIREQRGESPSSFLTSSNSVQKTKYRLKKGMPLWGIWLFAIIGLSLTYFYYSNKLTGVTENVLEQLKQIL